MHRLEFESLRGSICTASLQVHGSSFVPKIACGINPSQCDGLVIELLSLQTLTAWCANILFSLLVVPLLNPCCLNFVSK